VIDPLSPLNHLFKLTEKSVIVRRVVFFTCTCGISPTSSRGARQRSQICREELRDKLIERRDGPSLLLMCGKILPDSRRFGQR
jgi:hypothetical protein